MNFLGYLLSFFPIIKEWFYPYVIIIRQRLGRGERTIIERGKEVKKKDGNKYMLFMLSGREKTFPSLGCITPLKENRPLDWLGGKLVECTLINDELTWLNPSVDYSVFASMNNNERGIHLQNLKAAVNLYDLEKEKQDPLEKWLPVFVQIFCMVFFLLGMLWVLNNGGADMYESIMSGFREGSQLAGEVGDLAGGLSDVNVPMG